MDNKPEIEELAMSGTKELQKNKTIPWIAKVITLFPEMFPGALAYSLLGKALKKNLWSLDITNLRDFSSGSHKTVDGPPTGGGAGLVLRADVLDKAICHTLEKCEYSREEWPILALSPRGQVFDQAMALDYSLCKGLTIICGRYEGFDERVLEFHGIPEISLGDFVMSGGEIAAQVLIDTTVRLIPDVIGNQESLVEESFSKGLLEYPQYTNPRIWRGLPIPEELYSGHHEKIKQWRKQKSEDITKNRRPDIWDRYQRAKKTEVM